MAKVGILKKPSGWTLVLLIGLVLGVLALIDGGYSAPGTSSATSSVAGVPATAAGGTAATSSCSFLVISNQLNVRAAPAQDAQLVRPLGQGQQVAGTAVQQNAYRQLADGTWAVAQYLQPVAGSTCS